MFDAGIWYNETAKEQPSFGPQITLQQGDMDMKKRVTFLAALLVAACFGATVAMAEGSAKVTAQSGLNMRQGPGTNYKVVTTAQP